jgi:L-aminopeptidase/D-esterase-like protein
MGAMDNPNRTFETSGQGAFFVEVKGTKIFACVILNSLGAIINKEGEKIKGHLDHTTNKRLSMMDQVEKLELHLQDKNPLNKQQSQNTTLTVVVTNQAINDRELKQVARQVHSSMSKMIDPFHTISDGDVLFFVTTDEITNDSLPSSALGSFATDVVWDAVLNCFE